MTSMVIDSTLAALCIQTIRNSRIRLADDPEKVVFNGPGPPKRPGSQEPTKNCES